MAKSGSTTVKADQALWMSTYLEFSWEIIEQSRRNNTSTLSWQLRFYGKDGGFHGTGDGIYTVTIDGQQFTGAVDLKLAANESKVLVSDTITLSHNSNGFKNFSYSFTLQSSKTSTDIAIGSGGGELDSILRPARIESASSFNDEESPVVKWYTPSGINSTSIQICVFPSSGTEEDGIPYRNLNYTAGWDYTYNFTTAEREQMRQWITTGSNRLVTFRIKTVLVGETYTSDATVTLSLINYLPTLNPIVEDSNDTTFALTGNRGILIKNESIPVYAINATARKGATIVKQWVVCGEQVNTSETGDFSNITSGTFEFVATDSRGHTVSQTITRELVEYVKPTISVDTSAPTSVDVMRVTLSGVGYPGSFGAVNNTVTVQYRYKAVNYPDETYTDWIIVSPTLNNNRYSIEFNLDIEDYRLGYNFQAKVVDKLYTVEAPTRTLKNLPIFDWGENDFNFNVPVSMTVGHINYNLYGLCRAMTEKFEFSADAIEGANYSLASFKATLVGNCLRCNLSATRNAATGGALITNEKVCEVTIHHGEKISDMLNVCFGNGATGGVASFYTTEVAQTGETISFSIYLASTAQNDTSFDTYFIIPVTLNLDKFVE